jgi:hypothetical protein
MILVYRATQNVNLPFMIVIHYLNSQSHPGSHALAIMYYLTWIIPYKEKKVLIDLKYLIWSVYFLLNIADQNVIYKQYR